jgi:gluconate 5-dehydrogenase
MKPDLKGYTALVTGGSSGLGFQMSKALLEAGATVIIAARAGERLEKAKEALARAGDVSAVAMDVRDEGSVARAAEWFRERFDRLDMLVCCAGIGNNAPGMEALSREHDFWDIPAVAVRAVLETNLLGFFLTSRSFVPRMGRGGRVVYVSTSDATMTRPGQLPYGPSKAGAEAMAAIMAQELEPKGIRVNVICPGGFTDTNMAPPGLTERMRASGLPVLPPTVLNEVILYLASPAAADLTGEKLVGKDFAEWLAEHNTNTQ